MVSVRSNSTIALSALARLLIVVLGLPTACVNTEELFSQPLGIPVNNFEAQLFRYSGDITKERIASYGKFQADGGFVFHGDKEARRFFTAMQEGLCYQLSQQGKLAWKARISPTDRKLAGMVVAYFDWYRSVHPDDKAWGLSPCPSDIEPAEDVLAQYGTFIRDERFLFHNVAKAEAFWKMAHTENYACRRENKVVVLINPGARLAMMLTAMRYWAKADIVHLRGGVCVGWGAKR